MLKRKPSECYGSDTSVKILKRKPSECISSDPSVKILRSSTCILRVYDDHPKNDLQPEHKSGVESKSQLDSMRQGREMDTTQKQISIYKDLLLCPMCHELLLPPIILCHGGHSLCAKCEKKIRVCPLCNEWTGRARNFKMDAIVKELILPCKYAKFGCDKPLQYADRPKHEEEECEFKPYKCFNCGVEMQQKNMEDHFSRCWSVSVLSSHNSLELKPEHNMGTTIYDEFVRYDFKNGTFSFLGVVKIRNVGLFIRRLTKKNSMWYMWYSVVMCVINAEKFRYTLDVSDINQEKHYNYTGPVYSAHIPEANIIARGQCFSMSEKTVSQLRTLNDTLLFKTKILRCDGQK